MVTDCVRLAETVSYESSASGPGAAAFPQVATRKRPLKTHTLCEALLRDWGMNLTPDRAATAVERQDCPNCGAPAGSACRTPGGKTAAKYHTARFGLVPA